MFCPNALGLKRSETGYHDGDLTGCLESVGLNDDLVEIEAGRGPVEGAELDEVQDLLEGSEVGQDLEGVEVEKGQNFLEGSEVGQGLQGAEVDEVQDLLERSEVGLDLVERTKAG